MTSIPFFFVALSFGHLLNITAHTIRVFITMTSFTPLVSSRSATATTKSASCGLNVRVEHTTLSSS